VNVLRKISIKNMLLTIIFEKVRRRIQKKSVNLSVFKIVLVNDSLHAIAVVPMELANVIKNINKLLSSFEWAV